MKSIKLIIFEVCHEIRSITFIIVLLLFSVFIVTQMRGIFHYPIKNDTDIKILNGSGELDYIFIKASEVEVKSKSINYLENSIKSGAVVPEKVKDVQHVIELLKNHSFNDVYETMNEDEYIAPWIRACKSQFMQKIGSIDEVNENLHNALGDKGYGPLLYRKYVTYMQISASFLIFPIFLLLFTRDSRHNMSEVLYSQPISSTRYILCRYFGALIPLLIFFYAFGVLLNLISTIRFFRAGWSIDYVFFFKNFMVYMLPSIIFLSAFIMFFMILFKRAIAVFPIYIVYIIFNATPKVFEKGGSFSTLFRVIIRLDGAKISTQDVILNRLIYLILAVVFIFNGCKLYGSLRNNLRKDITI